MNTSKRKFLKAFPGWLGLIILGVGNASIAVTLAQRAIKPKGKHPKDVLCGFQPSPGKRPLFSKRIICRDYMQRPVIEVREYGKGDIQRQDLTTEQDCSKCNFEDVCVCSGTRFSYHKKKFTRTFYPELFDKSLKIEFVNG